jgi:hypothetical protein
MSVRGAVQELVRDRLGCTCPDPVFERIILECRGGASPEADMRIGDRLLIHLRRPGSVAAAEAALEGWLAAGREARDREGLNRFRLVLGLEARPEEAQRLLGRFLTLSGGDPRLHLHLIAPEETASLLDLEGP